MTIPAPHYHSHHAITVPHGFFGRHGGTSTGLYDSLNCGFGSDDEKNSITQNRARAASALNLAPDRLAGLYQIHSADVITITDHTQLSQRPKADGLVTALPDIGLAILTADCTPLLFHDAQSGIIGACHAGWRGAALGIIENTLRAMIQIGANLAHITALIGPTIAQPSYQVGADMRDEVLTLAPHAEPHFIACPANHDKYLFNLPAFAASACATAPLGKLAAIHDLALNTYPENNNAESPQFFSHRKATHLGQPDTGRQIAIITNNAHNQP